MLLKIDTIYMVSKNIFRLTNLDWNNVLCHREPYADHREPSNYFIKSATYGNSPK